MDISQTLHLIVAAEADPLEVMAACERLKAFADARQLVAIQDLCEQEPPCYDPTGELVDAVPTEIACYLNWSPYAASRRVDLADELHEGLPNVLDALAAGQLDLAKATEIAHATCGLTVGARVGLADRAIQYGAGHTRAELRAWLARQVVKLDPELAEQRRRKSTKKRRVWVQPETDGMATLGAYLTAEEAQACYNAVHTAAANQEGGIDAARADVLVERLTGLSATDPIPVQVLVTPQGAEITGYGPISPTHVAQLTANSPLIALKKPPMSPTYSPTAVMTRYIRARDRRCQFKGCRRAAMHCDLDHIISHPTGPTATWNLHCLCRFHHRQKTHTGWTVTRHPDGTTTWTSPRGHTYSKDPDDP